MSDFRRKKIEIFLSKAETVYKLFFVKVGFVVIKIVKMFEWLEKIVYEMFWSKTGALVKIQIFEKYIILYKMKNFVKNQKFCQKSKFLQKKIKKIRQRTKIDNLANNWYLRSIFVTKMFGQKRKQFTNYYLSKMNSCNKKIVKVFEWSAY